MEKYLPLAAANEFIARAGKRGLSHMKLQKLIYLSVEEWLENNEDSFLSRNPEVWQYGPVFSDLYHALKHHRSENISELQDFFDQIPRIDDQRVLSVIDSVWERYKATSAINLSDLTHKPGGPWHQVAKKHDFRVPFGTEIPLRTMRDYVRSERSKAVA
jgi:uncharacterized phage-associated protein